MPRLIEATRLATEKLEAAVTTTKVIQFNSTQESYGWLSNFSYHAIRVGGEMWPTTEHYFQAQKFAGTKYAERIRRTESVAKAARLGRDRSQRLRSNWKSLKEDVMLEALRAKFNQHDDLQRALLDTGDAHLVEHTARDAYWGDGGDGGGLNRLGVLLMQVREELRKASANECTAPTRSGR